MGRNDLGARQERPASAPRVLESRLVVDGYTTYHAYRADEVCSIWESERRPERGGEPLVGSSLQHAAGLTRFHNARGSE